MNFDVIWVPSAEAQLADIWINAPDRGAVTWAADRIDRLLGTHSPPASRGRTAGGS